MDEKMVTYLANVTSRDLLEQYETLSEEVRDIFTFEMMQATRWGAVRMKVPVPAEGINWRVEMRTLDMQILPDENSAFLLFLYLLARLLNEREELNLYIPLSLSQANFSRAERRGAILKERFHFRVNPESSGPAVVDELLCQEVLFGKGQFKGIFTYI